MPPKPNEKLHRALQNLEKACFALEASVKSEILENRDLSGIVKDFEIAYELSWKTLKKELQVQGVDTTTPKDVFSKAYQFKLIENESIWLDIIEDRNRTVHVYDEKFARQICKRIGELYLPEFKRLLKNLHLTKK